MMSMGTRIEEKLRSELAPRRLEIRDDSSRHEGHAGWRPGGGTHFRVEIVSDAFAGKNRVERQRLVNRALGDIPGTRAHALAIRALAPGDAD